jgi:hypothetical protein
MMKHVRTAISAPLCIIALGYFTSLTAHAVLLVVPNSNTEVLGPMADGAPFGCYLQLCRVQEAYDTSQFSLLGTNGGFINRILFRFADTPGFFRPPKDVIHYPLTINLSTTSNGVNNLSTVFDQNTGADKTTVYTSTFNFRSLTGIGVVEPFGMVIPLSTPFFYNPTNGALLVDMVVGVTDLNNTGGACMDSVPSGAGTGLASVWHENQYYDTTMPTTGSLDAYSMVTQFDISAVNPTLPVLTVIPLSHTNILLNVTNGSPGSLYSVLTSTTLSSSPADWVSIYDNAFAQNGAFYLTNTIATNASYRFYTLRLN